MELGTGSQQEGKFLASVGRCVQARPFTIAPSVYGGLDFGPCGGGSGHTRPKEKKIPRV